MSYVMRYDGNHIQMEENKPKFSLRKSVTAILGVVFLLLCMHLASGGLCMLFAGQQGITHSAAEHMVENIREGMPVSDAVQTFCAEIQYEAVPN